MPMIFARHCRWLCLVSLWALAQIPVAVAQDEPQRQVLIREQGFVSPGRLRVFAKISEKEDDAFFPISTLGRDAFSLEIEEGGSFHRLFPQSLTQIRGLNPAPRRAMLIALDDEGLNELAEVEARKVVAELLPKVDASHIAIYTKSRQGLGLLTESTPEASDNITSLQKALTVGGEALENYADMPLFCAMRKKINDWFSAGYGLGDHQTIFYFGRLDKEIFNNLLANVSCVKDLLNAKTTLYAFDVRRGGKDSLPSLREMFLRSGGYVERISDPEALYRSFGNMIRQVNEEYAIDFPLQAPSHTPINGRLRISYHGNVFVSQAITIAASDPNGGEAAAAPSSSAAAAAASKDLVGSPPSPPASGDAVYYGLLAGFGVIALAALVLFFRHLGAHTPCSFCHHTVQANHRDCPLKSRVAGLVVLRGEDVGTVYPLSEGINTLGTQRGNSIRLKKNSGAALRHASLTLKNQKALYQSLQDGQDLVNGWPVKEDRLLADGQVVQMGDLLLRFEIFRKA